MTITLISVFIGVYLGLRVAQALDTPRAFAARAHPPQRAVGPHRDTLRRADLRGEGGWPR